MAGLEVSRGILDVKAAEAVIAVREAFEKVETIAAFLANQHSDAAGGDPLTLSTVPTDPNDPSTAPGKFGYNADEAYLLRYLFESLTTLNIRSLLDEGRKLTGLS